MKRYFITLSLLFAWLAPSWGQTYRLQVAVFNEKVDTKNFVRIAEGHEIVHHKDTFGLYHYFLDTTFTFAEAQKRKNFLFQQGFYSADIYLVEAVDGKEPLSETTILLPHRIKSQQEYQLKPILFDHGAYRIRTEGRNTLDVLYTLLEANPSYEVKLEGHADAVGSAEFNKELALNRARAVRNYLTKKGISATRFLVDFYGESNPLAINKVPEGREINRRVDIKVIDARGYELYNTAVDTVVPPELQPTGQENQQQSTIFVRQ